MTAVMLLPTALQPLCLAPVRVRLMSLFVAITLVVGSAAPVVVGMPSDGLDSSAQGLITATASVALVSDAMAALLLACGARRCARDLSADDGAPAPRLSPAEGHITLLRWATTNTATGDTARPIAVISRRSSGPVGVARALAVVPP